MRKCIAVVVLFGGVVLAQNTVHQIDKNQLKEWWKMWAVYHSTNAELQSTYTDKQKQLSDNLSKIGSRIKDIESKLCPSGDTVDKSGDDPKCVTPEVKEK